MKTIDKKNSKSLLTAIGMLLVSIAALFYSKFLYFLLVVLFGVIWIIFILMACFRMLKKKKNGLPLLIVSILSILISVGMLATSHPEPAFLSQKDIVANDLYHSPDEKNAVVIFNRDLGGFGYTRSSIAIVLIENKDKEDLTKSSLPNGEVYTFSKWIDSSNVEFIVDVRNYQSERRKFKNKIKSIKGINILLKEKGFDTSLPLFVESRIESPDKKHEIIAYRYKNNTRMNDLHISVIQKGEEIPQIGNLFNFISDSRQDFFNNRESVYLAKWKTNKIITFYTTDNKLAKRQLNNFTDFSVEFVEKQCPDIKNNPEECPVKSTSAEAGWYHQMQYSDPERVRTELQSYGQDTTATIVDEEYIGDGYDMKMVDIAYVYEYQGKKYLGILRKKHFSKDKFEIGNKFKVTFSTKNPDIHQQFFTKN